MPLFCDIGPFRQSSALNNNAEKGKGDVDRGGNIFITTDYSNP